MSHTHTHDHSHNHENFNETKREELTKLLMGAVFFAAAIVIEKFTKLPNWAFLICYAVSYITVGFEVVKRAIEDIMEKNIFNECLLMSVASIGALAIHEYEEACEVMLLYSLGEFIHGAAIARSKKEIRSIEEKNGHRHVHEGSEQESFIARFAKFYTPVICLIAIFVLVIPPVFLNGAWNEWLYRALSVLVIGCPCAIVISVPLSFSCAIDACTKKGIFVYHSHTLEELYKNRNDTDTEKFKTSIIAEGDFGEKLEIARKAAKKAVIIARENIAFALAVKAIVLVLEVFLDKTVPMGLAAFADVGIAVIAILNSLRSLRIK